jgi:hypothetical protein
MNKTTTHRNYCNYYCNTFRVFTRPRSALLRQTEKRQICRRVLGIKLLQSGIKQQPLSTTHPFSLPSLSCACLWNSSTCPMFHCL